MADVVCLGILVVDVIARPVEKYPAPGELILTEAVSPFIGGCAANTGITLQKLGVSTAVIGKIGHDGFGVFIQNSLSRFGVDTHGVREDPHVPSSATLVTVQPNGERSFIHSMGANAVFKLDDIDWSIIEQAKILHIAGHFLMSSFDGAPCAQVLERAKQMGLQTSLDTAGQHDPTWPEKLRPCLPHLDFFLPSLSEARQCVELKGKADTPSNVARAFLDAGVGVVALKMGEEGSLVCTQNEEFWIPPFSVQAVDATGAGDAFVAGFLAGILNNFGLIESGTLGNAAGALCATAVGTVDGVRSLPDTLKFIEQHELTSEAADFTEI